jgi:hypothetical protein
MDQQVDQTLATAPCDACSRPRYVAALHCPSCKVKRASFSGPHAVFLAHRIVFWENARSVRGRAQLSNVACLVLFTGELDARSATQELVVLYQRVARRRIERRETVNQIGLDIIRPNPSK